MNEAPSLLTLTLADCLRVVSRMRDEDRACCDAFGDWTVESFAISRFQAFGPAWTLTQKGVPWAIGGLSLPNDWTGVLWFVSRPDLTLDSARKFTRQARALLRLAGDASHPHFRHRIEAHCLSRWPEANRYAERLGLTKEGTRYQVGRNREDVNVWVQLR